MAPARKRIGAIESLRGLAAMSILAYHAAFGAGVLDRAATLRGYASPLSQYATQLAVGVTIFFLISGFLLYRPFVRARVLGTRQPWVARYAVSRVLRIVPAYWVALAVIAVWLGLSGVFTLTGIPTYFGFLQIYSHDPATVIGGLRQAWTLCTEVAFYAFLPLYALLMRKLPGGSAEARIRGEWLGLAALFIAGTAWNAIVLHFHASGPGTARLLFSLPAWIDMFALGMGLAVLATAAEYREPRGVLTIKRFPGVALLVSAVAFWAAASQVGPQAGELVTGLEYETRHLLFGLVALGLLLPAVFPKPEGGWVHWAMTTRPGCWLGEISYGIYLWHLAFVIQLGRWGVSPPGAPAVRWLEWILLATLPTTAAAAASWYGLERPALALRDRLAQRLSDYAVRLRRKPVPATEPERETDIAAP
ncbi:MAG: acyltransferase family protein [Solirubrobacterales bacterium]